MLSHVLGVVSALFLQRPPAAEVWPSKLDWPKRLSLKQSTTIHFWVSWIRKTRVKHAFYIKISIVAEILELAMRCCSADRVRLLAGL